MNQIDENSKTPDLPRMTSYGRLLIFLALAVLSLLLAGARQISIDFAPVTSQQQIAVTLANTPEWQEAARQSPLWFIKINCRNEVI